MEIRKTALVLGGGGSRGAYEIGAWQGLRELGIPIQLVTGTSVGAINGALIAQDSFELAVALWKELDTAMVFDVELKNILANNGLSQSKLKSLLHRYIDEDAVRRSPVEYGLVAAELPSMTPQFFMKEQIPQGKLIDYILASSTLFPAMKSYEIDNMKFIDGGFTDNLPVGLALDHGASHVFAVNLDALGVLKKNRFSDAEFFRIVQCPWDLGNFMIFDKSNSRKIMRLGYLDTLKTFNVYDGNYFCFVKGEFDKRSLNGADFAGYIFDLDPQTIYIKYIFDLYLKDAVSAHVNAMDKDSFSQSFNIKDLFLEGLSLAKTALSPKTMTLLIARSLKGISDDKNVFLTKPAMKLFRNEITAANYLIKEGLI